VSYTDAWKRGTQTQRVPARHNQTDPAHNKPTDQEQIFWIDTSGDIAPGMPSDVQDDQANIGTPTTHGYIDTTPQGGDFGMPAFPGFTIEEGQAVRAVAHAQDFGAFDARKYTSPPNRDGTLNVGMVDAPDYEGNPAEQNNIRWVTGVGGPYDGGNSVHNKRIKRWRDRVVDFHWWEVQMNPSYARYATPAVTKPAVTGDRNQTMSPYSAGEILYDGGAFTLPQERRTPEPWDTALIQSGTPDPGSDFGLGQWGL
jgi:hypothetical protein